jgi:hypothetical protein
VLLLRASSIGAPERQVAKKVCDIAEHSARMRPRFDPFGDGQGSKQK